MCVVASLCVDGKCIHGEPISRRVDRVLCLAGSVKLNRNVVDECALYEAPKAAPKPKAKAPTKRKKRAKK